MKDSALLEVVANVLDGLQLGMCVFDRDDRTLLWNRTFLDFFPEHAGHVHVGEPYQANLRRFYRARLGPDELPLIDSYIEAGIARHKAQTRPYTFDHRGRTLRVASLPLGEAGRVRVWLDETAGSQATTAGKFDVATTIAESVKAFGHISDAVVFLSVDGRIVWANQPFVVMYGLHDGASTRGQTLEGVYRTAWEHHSGSQPESFGRGLQLLAENLRFAGAPFEIPLPDRRSARVIEQKGPEQLRILLHVDVTELTRRQEDLRRAEAQARESEVRLAHKSAMLEATLQNMEQGVVMIGPTRVVEFCNHHAIDLLGLPEALMASRPTFDAVLDHQCSNAEFATTPDDVKALLRSEAVLARPYRYQRSRPDGRVIEVCNVPIAGGGALRTYSDITERKRADDRIRHVARHDGLTSLVNREVFLEHLAGASSLPGAVGFAVHFIDLDHFKPINDTHGHATGDRVLAEVAARLGALARDIDVVARLGGDEFAILQRRADEAGSAFGLARRALDAICQPIVMDSLVVQVGACIGIAHFPADGVDAEALLRCADAAMYEAKRSGRGTIKVAT